MKVKRRWHRTCESVGDTALYVGYLMSLPILLPCMILWSVVREFVVYPIVIAWHLRGGVETAWRRCLPLWKSQDSIWDLRGKLVPFYTPSLATCIARSFAAKFRHEHRFLADRVSSADEREANCAIEMLLWVCSNLESIPEYLLSHPANIPQRELPPTRTQMTIGEYIRCEMLDPDAYDALWHPQRIR